MNKKYTIFWVPFEKNSDLTKSLGLKLDIELPYLVDKEHTEGAGKEISYTLDAECLLFGLLVCYFSSPPFSVTHKIKPYFNIVLEDVLSYFKNEHGFNTNEECILAAALHLKRWHGIRLGYRALKAGHVFLPESARIRDEFLKWEKECI